jgi:membrane-anchored protein YejM (alkaline phosphatase superfamily)
LKGVVSVWLFFLNINIIINLGAKYIFIQNYCQSKDFVRIQIIASIIGFAKLFCIKALLFIINNNFTTILGGFLDTLF